MRQSRYILAVLAYSVAILASATALAKAPAADPAVTDAVARLGRTLGQEGAPDHATQAPCSTPGVYAETGKSLCIVVAWGDVVAMAYLPQHSGNEPKPAKGFRLDRGLWSPVTLLRPE